MKIDTDTDEGKAEIQKMIDEAVNGLKEKTTQLLADIRKQKDERKEKEDQLEAEREARAKAEEEPS